ncbi:MAG: hypothetical protein ACRELF_17600 [Gemmataceae bacterium]
MAFAEMPLLRASVAEDVLVLTIVQPRIQGEEIAQQLRDEMDLAVTQSAVDRVVIDLH